jgi:hypothetical protein
MKPAMMSGLALGGPVGATIAGIGCVLWSAMAYAIAGERDGYGGVAGKAMMHGLHDVTHRGD